MALGWVLTRPQGLSTGMFRRVVTLLAGSGLAQVASLFTFVLCARALGPSTYGSLMGAYGVAVLVAAAIDFGGTAHAIRSLSGENDSLPLYLAQRRTRSFISLSVASLGLAYFCFHWDTPYGVFALVPILGSLWARLQFALAWLRANGHNTQVAAAQVIDKAATLGGLGLIFLSPFELTAAGASLALMAGPLTGGAVASMLTRSALPGPVSRTFWFTNPWVGTGGFGWGSVALGFQSLDIQVTNAVAGSGAAGAYAAVSRWGTPLGLFASVTTQAAFPLMVKAGTSRDAIRVFGSASKYLVIPGFFLCVTFIAADPIVHLVLGAAYDSSVPVVKWLAIGLSVAVLNQPLAVLLQSRSKERLVAGVLLIGVGSHLSLTYFLAAEFGAVGAAMAFGSGQALIFACLTSLVYFLLWRRHP